MIEEDIRPKLIFDEYLRLAKIDTKVFFGNVLRESIPCPACGTIGEPSFSKDGFDYELCPDCDTLFVSPRPINEAFNSYYSNSPSTEYWATTFYKATANARREKIWKPKAKLIHQIIKRFGDENEVVVDIGGGYGIFAEEMYSLFGKKTTVIEPGFHLANSCREKGINVIEKFLEDVKESDLSQGSKIFVSFELFEHLHSPEDFLKQLFKLMQPGDLFVFTTLSGTGVDIQALWEDSKSISTPPSFEFLEPLLSQGVNRKNWTESVRN
jgi:SAM-dependent methyltransferase